MEEPGFHRGSRPCRVGERWTGGHGQADAVDCHVHCRILDFWPGPGPGRRSGPGCGRHGSNGGL